MDDVGVSAVVASDRAAVVTGRRYVSGAVAGTACRATLRQVRYWRKIGLIQPSHPRGLYSRRDLAILSMVVQMRAATFSIQDLRVVVPSIVAALPQRIETLRRLQVVLHRETLRVISGRTLWMVGSWWRGTLFTGSGVWAEVDMGVVVASIEAVLGVVE